MLPSISCFFSIFLFFYTPILLGLPFSFLVSICFDIDVRFTRLLQQKKREMVASAFGEDETGSRQTRLTVEDLKYLFMYN